MGEVITIPQNEVKTITKRSSLVGMDYNPKTIDECTKLYKDASQIAEIAKMAVKDGLQGKALLEAKKLMCGDEWSLDIKNMSSSIRSKWLIFLSELDLITVGGERNGLPKTNVKYLLDFAGYKESGGEIETASHYREVKKVVGSNTKEIDKAYNDAGGKELTTAKQVKEEVKSKKIYLPSIFEKIAGEVPQFTLAPLEFPRVVMESLPDVTPSEWKSFYRKMSHCIHPDKGGDDIEMMILSSMNKSMQVIFKRIEETKASKEYRDDYNQWKKDKGYESDFIKEDEL